MPFYQPPFSALWPVPTSITLNVSKPTISHVFGESMAKKRDISVARFGFCFLWHKKAACQFLFTGAVIDSIEKFSTNFRRHGNVYACTWHAPFDELCQSSSPWSSRKCCTPRKILSRGRIRRGYFYKKFYLKNRFLQFFLYFILRVISNTISTNVEEKIKENISHLPIHFIFIWQFSILYRMGKF